jgi:hypothetical protein
MFQNTQFDRKGPINPLTTMFKNDHGTKQ